MPQPETRDALTGLSTARFGVYVHFPYCLSKCPYCDFASTAAKVVPERRYASAVRRELEAWLSRWPELREREVHSVYFGGGTPSLWAPTYVAELMRLLRSELRFGGLTEVTLEANPGASDAVRFAGFREAGVNRLSLGVQSFRPSQLRFLGRAHDDSEAESAFRRAREAGFTNVSMDFIYAVPGQTLEDVVDDAKRARDLDPDHLSAYALTLDRESLAEEVPLAKQLARGELSLPEDELAVAMQRAIAAVYEGAGLDRCEISNYARPGLHSLHNTLYWTGGEYLALGSGATGFVLEGSRHGVRYSNHRSAEKYLDAVENGRSAAAQEEPLGARELFHERLSMGLRLASGIDVGRACEEWGEPFQPRLEVLKVLVREGLAEERGSNNRLTPRGMDVHSAIAAKLM